MSHGGKVIKVPMSAFLLSASISVKQCGLHSGSEPALPTNHEAH